MVNLADDESTWVVDSSASFHLTPKKECFSSYTTEDYDYVKMGNDDTRRIIGIGNVCLLTSTGYRMLLKDVRHVLNIRLNLISTGRLDDEGYNGSFQNGKCKFYHGNLIVTRAQKEGTLYRMHAQVYKSEANVAADSSGEIWHKRLGHMSERGMHILADQKLLPEVKGVHLERCVDYLVGKQNRVAFTRDHQRGEKQYWNWYTQTCATWILHRIEADSTS
mgnify:CR=1 FL=1